MTKLLAGALIMMAGGASLSDAAEPTRKLEVAFDAPATNYGVKIESVYLVEGELWVLSRVIKKGDFGGAAITRVKDSILIPDTDDTAKRPIRHKVLGKTWNWGKDTKELSYIASEKELLKDISKKKGVKIASSKKKSM